MKLRDCGCVLMSLFSYLSVMNDTALRYYYYLRVRRLPWHPAVKVHALVNLPMKELFLYQKKVLEWCVLAKL